MPTLSDDAFLAEVDSLISGRDNLLVPKVETAPVDPPAAEIPPVESPPAVDPPPVDAPPVEPPPAVEPPKEGEAPPVEIVPPAEPDYKGVYTRLFGSPIRAGGQDITLENVDEAVSLIQKGVGFHHKMNKLQGDLRYVEMLRNNQLLDEGKLSLLIDAQAGKPGAIKKLLDSAKIDPLTLDSTEASSYAPSDHGVTEEQVRFQSTVNDLTETTHGTAVLQDARSWDQASKAEIYKNPDTLTLLSQQKENGRYDLIKNQVDRQRAVGQIPTSESFLQSYIRVGQQMMQAGSLTPKVIAPTPTPVAQKVVTPQAPANSKQAAAAAPTRTSGTPKTTAPKPIEKLSDDDFMKVFKQTFSI